MEIWDATRVAVEASSSSLRVDTPIGVKALFSLFFSLWERGYVGRRGITVGEQLSSLFTCDEETGAGGRVRAVRGEGLSTCPLGCWPMVMGVVAVVAVVAVGTARCSGESQPWLWWWCDIMGEWVGDPLIPGSDWTRIRVFPASTRSAKEKTQLV